MLILDDVNSKLKLVTATGADVDVVVHVVDHTTTGGTAKKFPTLITTATTTDILAAPAASTQRQVRLLTVKNADTIQQTVKIVLDVSATEYEVTPNVVLDPGEMLQIDAAGVLSIYKQNGALKTGTDLTRYNGRAVAFLKASGTAPEAAGFYYCFAKDAGNPGAWAIGTPGVNGRNPDGTSTTDNGCIYFVNAVTGEIYLTGWNIVSSRVGTFLLIDILWINTGLLLTTGAQAIVSGAMPARDVNGSADGVGLGIGLLITTAMTTGAANATATVSYTNSEGVAGRTATLVAATGNQIPATAVVGTFIPFQLQAGDRGVRSIQSFNNGTLQTGGAQSLLVYRVLDQQSIVSAAVGTPKVPPYDPGVRLYDGTCMFIIVQADGTTAYIIGGTVQMMER